jgi:hypothetical protein
MSALPPKADIALGQVPCANRHDRSSGNRKTGKGREMTHDYKLAKRAHKLGYRYITRWPAPTIGTEHILEHKDGDRHFRSMDEVERFIGEQEIAKLERGKA